MKSRKDESMKDENVTINDLLSSDDVKRIFEETSKELPNIDNVLIIYFRKNETFHWDCTPELTESKIVWAMEFIKHELFEREE